MKKFLCMALAMVLMFMLCSCGSDNNSDNVSADLSEAITTVGTTKAEIFQDNSVSKPEDFEGYEMDGGFCIDKYTGSAKVVNIPEELCGKKVTSISITTFDGVQIREVTFPSGITEVPDRLFAGKAELETVVLNEGIKNIGMYAFVNCTSLKEINFPSTLEVIEDYAFVGCEKIDKVDLKEGLLEIGMTVFVANFESVTVPSTVTSVGMNAFSVSEILKDVYFLGKDTVIDDYAIDDCPNVVIHGYSGSTAETFANNRGFEFVAM